MSKAFILLSMIFLHIADDYYVQGKLAEMKQREWWIKHAPDEMYRYDYLVALVTHGFSWAFCVMLPIAVSYRFNLTVAYCIMFVANLAVHSFVDTLKANKRKINLLQDQAIHLIQIIITYFVLIGMEV